MWKTKKQLTMVILILIFAFLTTMSMKLAWGLAWNLTLLSCTMLSGIVLAIFDNYDKKKERERESENKDKN